MAKYIYGKQFNNDSERKAFIDFVYKEMNDRGLSVQSLADAIGYSRKSLYQFFNDPSVKNKFLAAALENYLK